MSDNNDLHYANKLSLMTLKGQVVIHFLDGKLMEGEFVTQDAFNIFLIIDDEPLMIPRSQIRYIRGRPGQPIEADYSQEKIIATETEHGLLSTQPDSTDTALPAVEATDKEVDDLTFFFPADEDVEDATVFLEEDDTDETLWLDEGDEDSTVVLDEETPIPEAITAYLDCTTGPHAGAKFELQSGVSSIGRSVDNVIALSKDKEVSRRHAAITYDDGKFLIQDRGSLNGVIINDVRIEQAHHLEPGDRLLIGVSTMIFYEE